MSNTQRSVAHLSFIVLFYTAELHSHLVSMATHTSVRIVIVPFYDLLIHHDSFTQFPNSVITLYELFGPIVKQGKSLAESNIISCLSLNDVFIQIRILLFILVIIC